MTVKLGAIVAGLEGRKSHGIELKYITQSNLTHFYTHLHLLLFFLTLFYTYFRYYCCAVCSLVQNKKS